MVHRYWSCPERDMGGCKAIAVWWAFYLPAMEDETTKRRETIDRHVRVDGYFATAATILDLQQQELARRCGRGRRSTELLRSTTGLLQEMRDDLMYLQKHYKIVRRKART